nr:hypothetical protein [Vulcanisaeta sp. JCM 14467]
MRTLRAQWVLERSRVIIGYNTYLGLITDVLGGKEVIGAGMGEELFRAGVAIRRALETRDDVAWCLVAILRCLVWLVWSSTSLPGGAWSLMWRLSLGSRRLWPRRLGWVVHCPWTLP